MHGCFQGDIRRMLTAMDNIAADRYDISSSSWSELDAGALLDAFIAEKRADRLHVLGFPGNLDFRFSRFAELLNLLVNNVGDPHSPDKSAMNSKAMERAVIAFMAELANGDPAATYGYVTSGGSEANQFGLHQGCVQLPQARVYCSAAAHYSIRKNARLMRRELVVVGCDAQGRLDPSELARACRADAGRGAVVAATIGATMTGAVDDVDALVAAAAAAGRVYVHLDAALGGLVTPFTAAGPRWGFARPEVGSVAVSMHKFLGMPVPCAVALCRSDFVESRVEGEYVGATDATLGCSRNGLACALLWYSLATQGWSGLAANAQRGLDLAEYAAKRLADAGLQPVAAADSVVVVFDRPAEWVCRKYHLATEGDRAHIVTVGHVTEEMIDQLCRAAAAHPRPGGTSLRESR
ncbi:MAG: aminotransferase class I/II-fold pyridoxal phosphate-dependent enzyme [Mycobacteriaceae bacterium]|nr:aminotransferase class I/II-fold pyridoxal phosphate-dependent enzyme [Mycobacteriaceae bacterium]